MRQVLPQVLDVRLLGLGQPDEGGRIEAHHKFPRLIACFGGQFEDRPLESVFEPGEPVLQQVNDHLYWIVELKFSGWREAGAVSNTVPVTISENYLFPSGLVLTRIVGDIITKPGGFTEQ